MARGTTTGDALVMGGAELAEDQTLRLGGRGGGFVVAVDRGRVLVTREGDPEDHVLEAGAELRVDRPGRVVAWALRPSALRVRPASTARGERTASRRASRWSVARG